MIATDYYQLYSIVVGAYMNTKMWHVLSLLGLPFLPFALMLLKNIGRAMEQGEDEGSKSDLLLAYSTVDFIKMFLVVLFFLIPMGAPISLSSTTVKEPQCNVQPLSYIPDMKRAEEQTMNNTVDIDKVKISGDTGPEKSLSQINTDNAAMIGNISPQLPIIPKLIVKMTIGASTALTAALPCPTSLEAVSLATKGTPLDDVSKDIQDVAKTFAEQCYLPSVRQASNDFKRTPTSISEKFDPTDSLFTATNTYYDRQTISIDTKKINELKRIEQGTATPNLSALTLDSSNHNNYQMTCNDLYKTMSSSIIKEQRTLHSQSPYYKKVMLEARKKFGLTEAQIDQERLRNVLKRSALFNVQKNDLKGLSPNSGYADKAGSDSYIYVGTLPVSMDGVISGVAAIGSGISSAIGAPESRAMRMVVPMYFHVILFSVLTLMPAIIVTSGYNSKAIAGMIGGLIVGATASLVSAVNGFLIELYVRMVEGQGSFSLDNVVNQLMIINFSQNLSTIFPVIWAVLFGYIGFQGAASSGVAIGSAGGVAQKGISMIKDAGSKGIKGGKGK
ncbi:conjugal transfer protein TraG N-terminal domain-containing protein [Photobacterium sp. GB-72]|uniref:conjugal transfer protein TraG N-terminal domain-containing protein n=1 Tax=Photobacterium sp. GB-72 TaxID=2022105 RepID=UPI000D154543|nr:conjugal transfer protein TraG N-terminal domain-containing protein [Photobacterium sp. GB-72]PSV28071.1 hypothetical protein C9J40_19520 [Photobacterium sp. GB-72]